jgi:hypothetical protein
MNKMFQTWIPVLATMITGCAVAADGEPSAETAAPQSVTADPVAVDADAAGTGLPDHCYANVDSNVVRLDLASETITPTPDPRFGGNDVSSLGLTQNHLVGCSFFDTHVSILDLATGSVSRAEVPCNAVTAIGDKIYVLAGFDNLVTEYANLHALITKRPLRTVGSVYASRLGAGHGRLLAAWHSASEVLALDLTTGVAHALPLPSYDGWIFGLFENAKVRLVAGGWSETGINIYDRKTGAATGRVFDGVWIEGLACANKKRQ